MCNKSYNQHGKKKKKTSFPKVVSISMEHKAETVEKKCLLRLKVVVFYVDRNPCVLPICTHVTVVITLTHLPLECVFKPPKLPAVMLYLFVQLVHPPKPSAPARNQYCTLPLFLITLVVTDASLHDCPWTGYNTSAEPLASFFQGHSELG